MILLLFLYMKDFNVYIIEKLKINKNIKMLREEEEVFSVIYDFFTKENKLNEEEDFKIFIIKDKKSNPEFNIIFDDKLNNEVLKNCMNCGTELCKLIEKETGYDYYWSTRVKELTLNLSKDFI